MSDFTIKDILVGLVPLKIAIGLLQSLELDQTMDAKDIHTKLAKKNSKSDAKLAF